MSHKHGIEWHSGHISHVNPIYLPVLHSIWVVPVGAFDLSQ